MIKPRRAVIEMQEYKPPTSDRTNSLRLDFNENTVGCSEYVKKALKSMNFGKLAVYPQYNELRKAIADYCSIGPEEVIPTNGTDEAIKSVFEIYLEKGKNVLEFTPTKKGTIPFSCSMGMYRGKIIVE